MQSISRFSRVALVIVTIGLGLMQFGCATNSFSLYGNQIILNESRTMHPGDASGDTFRMFEQADATITVSTDSGAVSVYLLTAEGLETTQRSGRVTGIIRNGGIGSKIEFTQALGQGYYGLFVNNTGSVVQTVNARIWVHK